jgi:hypothetical protein
MRHVVIRASAPGFRRRRLVGLGVLLVLVGCTKAPETGEVEGVLLIKGQPGHKVRINFLPDAEKGASGPQSTAETDDQGRFKLELLAEDGPSRPGAVVGWHRVVLSDLQLAQSETGVGVPIRLKPDYSLPASTPLAQEVKPGKQTIELVVP